jgi:hypothetical protein
LPITYNGDVWEIEFTDEFGQWWESLSDAEQDALARGVELLRQVGPALGPRSC